nr:hypothetical protein [Pandoravirus aubagnensis]
MGKEKTGAAGPFFFLNRGNHTHGELCCGYFFPPVCLCFVSGAALVAGSRCVHWPLFFSPALLSCPSFRFIRCHCFGFAPLFFHPIRLFFLGPRSRRGGAFFEVFFCGHAHIAYCALWHFSSQQILWHPRARPLRKEPKKKERPQKKGTDNDMEKKSSGACMPFARISRLF